MKPYGKELILDLHDCDPSTFTRDSIANFMVKLCTVIDMERADLHFWDDVGVPEAERQTEPHLVGTSAVQFIMTSNITIHTLDMLKSVNLNIFSCKDFDAQAVALTVTWWFEGRIVNQVELDRL